MNCVKCAVKDIKRMATFLHPGKWCDDHWAEWWAAPIKPKKTRDRIRRIVLKRIKKDGHPDRVKGRE